MKRKPEAGELAKNESKDVSYKGSKYRLNVSEKMGADGVIETHLNYDSHAKPRRENLKPTLVYVPEGHPKNKNLKWKRWSHAKNAWVWDRRKGRGL